MKVLILGARGQIGRVLTESIRRQAWEPICPTRAELNICDQSTTANILGKGSPDAIVNAAAYTAVDRAETDPHSAYRTNRDGAALVAEAAAHLEVPLIHLSTDYVFDGRATSPYVETDAVAPLGVYARSKEAGERAVRAIASRHVILRTSWVYSPLGSNFLLTMLQLGANRREIHVVNDQIGCPTSAEDVAEAIVGILRAATERGFNDWGTYHCAGREAVSWYDFARAIFECAANFGVVPIKLEPVTTAEFPRPAPRPAYSVLCTQKLQRHFGVESRSLREPLMDCLERIHSRQPSEAG